MVSSIADQVTRVFFGTKRRTISILLVLLYVIRQRLKWARVKAIPTAPCLKFSNPFLGQASSVLRNRIENRAGQKIPDLFGVWQEASSETKEEGLFRFTFGHWLMPFCRTVIIVHGEKLVRHATSQKSWGLYRKGFSYHLARDLIGHQSLLACPDNELWRKQRRISQAAFRLDVLSTAVVPAVHAAVEGLCARWEAQCTELGNSDGKIRVEFCEEAPRLTIDVLGKVAFGFEFNQCRGGDAKGSDISEAFHTVLTRMARIARSPTRKMARLLRMTWIMEYEHALEVLNKAARDMIDNRLAQGDLGNDLVGNLLKAGDGDNVSLDRELVVDNLKTFLFAGHDTTASALCWCMHLLAAHQDVQERLAHDLSDLGTDVPSVEQLESVPYLDAVIRELLRVYPSAGFTKSPVEDVDLCGHRLPKDMEIFFFPFLTHRDERLFPEGGSFKPDRWLIEPLKSSSPERAGWMPFSLGARNCVGSRMALLELKSAVHALVSRYKLTLPEDAKNTPGILLFFTLEPNRVPLELQRRVASSKA